MDEEESLSDHLYIRFDISRSPASSAPRILTSPRWAVKRLNEEALTEASVVESWLSSSPEGQVDIVEEARWFQEAMTRISDAAMPRVRQQPTKRRVHWWSRDIARLRSECVAARRQYSRHRRLRQRREEAVEAQLYARYKEAKKALQAAIRAAKSRAREELLNTLDGDPWGRPYRMVLNCLRPWAPPITESLQPQFLEVILSELFPQRAEHSPPFVAPAGLTRRDEVSVPSVTEAELDAAVRRLRAKNTAPGPDGIPGRVWVLAMPELGVRLRRLFDACMELGQFPAQWKVGRLVLLRKQGRPLDSPSAYRPIVLLDEVGKLLERIVVRRLVNHLTRNGPDLSSVQYGFREGKSTVDAILRVKTLASEAVSQGGVLLAVSLDIANAFNSLPWECIMEALRYHGLPLYLRRLIGSYLEGRQVTCVGQDASTHLREISCGVPQGSVLGPLLWNIGYDWVLRGALLPGAAVTCYADDTLVTARGDNLAAAIRLITASVSQVVGRIRMLGLQVSLNKTEAICFHGPRRAPPPDTHIIVDGVRIGVSAKLKYLGLVLDSRWRFDEHFGQLVPRVMRCASALAGLLPNLGGAGTGCRNLYLGVIRSMALYGAPVWCDALTPHSTAILHKLQRLMANRLIRGYRTISFEAACLLGSSPPWELVAYCHAELYFWWTGKVARGECIAPREKESKRAHFQRAMFRKWREGLTTASAGTATVEAILPVFQQWIDRGHGALTYRLVQILTGHGCFGKYLHQIAGREPTARCHHCEDCEVDTARHTLEECSAWSVERRELTAVVGNDLSLPVVVRSMVEEERSWNAAVAFSETVLSQKEEQERQRERAPEAPIIRRGRTRRGRARAGGLHHQRPP